MTNRTRLRATLLLLFIGVVFVMVSWWIWPRNVDVEQPAGSRLVLREGGMSRWTVPSFFSVYEKG